MTGSDFIFGSVQLMYCKCHKVNFIQPGDSYINSPYSIKKKKTTINPINEDNKCFQYAAIVPLNCEELITSRKSFKHYTIYK